MFRSHLVQLCTFLLLAHPAKSLAQDVTLSDISKSYRALAKSVDTWSGEVSIVEDENGEVRRFSGRFAWAAGSREGADRCWCELFYPATSKLLDGKGGEVERRDTVLHREALVNGDRYTHVFHNVPRRDLPFGIPFRGGLSSKPVAVGFTEELESPTYIDAGGRFCPDYLFRSTIPAMFDVLDGLAREERDESRVRLEAVGAAEVRVIVLSDGEEYCRFLFKDIGSWVPVEFISGGSKSTWRWERVQGVLIPVMLAETDREMKSSATYSVDSSSVNEAISDTRFDRDAMAFKRGDYLGDRTNQSLYVYDGERFVDYGGDGVSRVRLIGLAITGLGIAAAVFILLRRRVRLVSGV